MDDMLFEQIRVLEERHWWWIARRAVLGSVLQDLELNSNAQILEVGCGAGGNLALLSKYGSVRAIETNGRAREYATQRAVAEVVDGSLPGRIPFGSDQFDLIALLDVLEHIDDEVSALRALGNRLKPNGRLLITVPACPSLWNQFDERTYHKRRYTRKSLREAARRAELMVGRLNYFNTILFPCLACVRLTDKWLGSKNDLGMPNQVLNSILCGVFQFERHLINRLPLPIGLSLLAVLQRK